MKALNIFKGLSFLLKRTNILKIIIPFIMIAYSCSKPCDCAQIVKEGSLLYKKGANEPYTGKCVLVYGSGKVMNEKKFEEGKRVYIKGFTEDGELYHDELYDQAGDISDLVRYYTQDGKVSKNKELEYKYNNGFLVSKKTWFPSYQIKEDITYIEGKTNDLNYFSHKVCKIGSKKYYENGQVQSEIVEPIKFIGKIPYTPNFDESMLLEVVYVKEGYIKSFRYEVGNNELDVYVVTSDFSGGYLTHNKWTFDQCKDINFVINNYWGPVQEEFENPDAGVSEADR